MREYPEIFYRRNMLQGRSTARETVPLVMELIGPKSVVDVGCSAGTWLAVFEECGVKDVFGIDGFYARKELLEIPQERFLAHDLQEPFRLDRTFDLVVSLEVAEHLPKESAVGFVDSLTRLGPVVLFSAAIPFQGGEVHLNEQWPEYWARLFEAHGYVGVDCLRKRVWHNPNVSWYYAQNILVYARRESLESYPRLKQEFEVTVWPPMALIHPTRYLATADLRQVPLRRLLKALPAAFALGVRETLKKRDPVK